MSIDISVNKNNKIGRASTRSLYKQKADIPGLSDNLLPVICKTPRVTYASQIRVGEKYYIDRMTLYIDMDYGWGCICDCSEGRRIRSWKHVVEPLCWRDEFSIKEIL